MGGRHLQAPRCGPREALRAVAAAGRARRERLEAEELEDGPS